MIKETRVENGYVRGVSAADPRIISYKGIPFAAPPVGENRWRAPQPAKDWEGVLDCCRFAPISMQCKPGLIADSIYTREWNVDPDIPMSEDCLYLNVWTPAKTTEERLPVFVWYFGGGLQEGNPAEMEFNGERIARRGIVVVTINYRLNVFGLLAHPELTASQPDAPTNFNHLDQMFATQWVKRNIAAFGGDPNNITIGGQSAGGRSVQVQLTNPKNEGLFQKAIIMSGARLGSYSGNFNAGVNRTMEQAEADGIDFFKFAGFKNLEEARAVDAFKLMDLFKEYANLSKGLGPWAKVWAPVTDNCIQFGNISNMMITGKHHQVPLMMTNTSNEAIETLKCNSFEEVEEVAKKCFGDRAGEFLAAIKADTLEETLENAKYPQTEMGLRVYLAAQLRDHPELPYYTSVFDPSIPGWDNPGTFHSSDLWFLFESLAACWRPFTGKHYDLARQDCNYVSNFIKTGNPNGPDADGTPMPEWKPYQENKAQMHYGDDGCKQPSEDSVKPVIKFLTDYYLSQF